METLQKQLNEVRHYDMKFKNVLDIGETISNISVIISEVYATELETTPDALSIDNQSIVGNNIKFRITGGSIDTVYKITIRVNTSDTNLIEGEGLLEVLD